MIFRGMPHVFIIRWARCQWKQRQKSAGRGGSSQSSECATNCTASIWIHSKVSATAPSASVSVSAYVLSRCIYKLRFTMQRTHMPQCRAHTHTVTPIYQCMHYVSVVFRRISAQRSTWEYNNFGIGTRRSNYEKIKTPDARNARYINILDAIRNLSFYVSRNPNSRWKHKSLERKPDLAT